MKNILKIIGTVAVAIFKKITGKKDDVLAQMPENVAITEEQINHCITIVNTVKDVVNNEAVVLITDLTPISLDNVIRQKISDALPVILAGLTFSKTFLNTADKNVLVNDLLSKVRFADDAVKDGIYHTLAARLIMVVSDGKVTWSEAVSLIELYFKKAFISS